MSTTANKRECDPLVSGSTLKRHCQDFEDEPPRKILEVSRATYRSSSQTNKGWSTPLHEAAWAGCVETVKKLLAEGADTRAQNLNGYTPLHTALYFLEEEAAECLVNADSKNNVQDNEGQSPLHVAAKYGYEKIVKMLLAGGADANPQDIKGKTPLHYAAKRNFGKIVKELLFNDAHPHLQDETGRYLLDDALLRNSTNILKMSLSICAFKDIVINWKELDIQPNKMQYCVQFISKCYAEAQSMKDVKMCGCTFSYHDIAKGHIVKAARYLENENVRNFLHQDLTHDFPNYAELIVFHVRRAERRRILTDQCLDCFTILSKKLPFLPRLSIDIIFSCLGEQDLQNLIKAFKYLL